MNTQTLIDTKEPTAVTGSKQSGVQRHFDLADGRAITTQATRHQGQNGFIVTVYATQEIHYTVPKHTRYFKLNRDRGGWMLTETGWTHLIGGDTDARGDDDPWLDLSNGPWPTKADAETFAQVCCLDEKMITE